MYFKTSLDFQPDVHFDLRSKDTKGIYITIEQFRLKAQSLIESGYDTIAELATETHVMNIPVTADQIISQAKYWSYLEPTHIRLGPEYKDVV